MWQRSQFRCVIVGRLEGNFGWKQGGESRTNERKKWFEMNAEGGMAFILLCACVRCVLISENLYAFSWMWGDIDNLEVCTRVVLDSNGVQKKIRWIDIWFWRDAYLPNRRDRAIFLFAARHECVQQQHEGQKWDKAKLDLYFCLWLHETNRKQKNRDTFWQEQNTSCRLCEL